MELDILYHPRRNCRRFDAYLQRASDTMQRQGYVRAGTIDITDYFSQKLAIESIGVLPDTDKCLEISKPLEHILYHNIAGATDIPGIANTISLAIAGLEHCTMRLIYVRKKHLDYLIATSTGTPAELVGTTASIGNQQLHEVEELLPVGHMRAPKLAVNSAIPTMLEGDEDPYLFIHREE